MRFLPRLILLLAPFWAVSSMAATTRPTVADTQTISVTESASDDQVRARIQTILEASGWFENIGVSNTKGIVTLTGTTEQTDHKVWAERIATCTETQAESEFGSDKGQQEIQAGNNTLSEQKDNLLSR